MTTEQLIEYYAKLLILQYIGKPNAFATVEALVDPVIMDQLPLAVQDAYNIDTAVGTQLDVLGKYVGVSRNGYDADGPITLVDSDFRLMINIAIIQNNAGSSLYTIQSLLNMFFPGTLLVFDFSNMQMGYFFDSSIGSKPLAELFVKQGLLPKPMGVQLASLIYAPNITNLFGMRTYDHVGFNVHGFNTYDVYDSGCPWLNYTYAIIF